jgi:hypothetical protein
VSQATGVLDAGNPGCDPESQLQLNGNIPGGGDPWELCEAIPQACLQDITCNCIQTANGWAPDVWICMVAPGGLVVVTEAPQSSGGS